MDYLIKICHFLLKFNVQLFVCVKKKKIKIQYNTIWYHNTVWILAFSRSSPLSSAAAFQPLTSFYPAVF